MSRSALEIITIYRGTVLDVRHLAPGEGFTVGPGAADLVSEHPALAAFDTHCIARHEANGQARIDVVQGLTAAVLIDGTIHEIERAGGIRLGPGQKARVDMGDVSLVCALVDAAPIIKNSRFRLLDRTQQRYLGAAAVLHAMVLAIAFTVPVQAGSLSMDGWNLDDRYADVLFVPNEPDVDPFQIPDKGDDGSNDGEDGTQVAQDPVPAPPKRPDEVAPKGDTAEERAIRKAIAKDAANQVTSALDDAMAEVNAGLGASAHAALEGLNGDERGDALAMGGDPLGGIWGTGTMPGMTGGPKGSAKIAGYGTKSGKGPGKYGNDVKTNTGDRDPGPPIRVIPRDPVVSNGLDKDQVQRGIRKIRKKIRYCYEKALQSMPDLEGKVRIRFLIGPSGEVLGAGVKENTVGRAEVGTCVANAVKRAKFPPVNGGGTVAVTYPFMFRSGR